MPTKTLTILAMLLSAQPSLAQVTPGAPKQPAPKPAAPAEQTPGPDPTTELKTTVRVVQPIIIPPSNWKPGMPIKTSDDMLSALETAGSDFRSLQADLQKTKTRSEIEGGGQLIYNGDVMFQSEPSDPKNPNAKPKREFQVDFKSVTADGVKRAEERTFVFDGQWFVERQPDVKQIRKRQIVPPGQTIDPLAIGEGPFPIPIGQKRERILQRFTADLRPSEEFPDQEPGKALPAIVADTYQLKLIPRPGTDESRQFREVRIWYRKSDMLPRVARTVDTDDAVNVFTLMNIKLNQPLPKDAFDTTVPQGWDAQIDEYRKSTPEAGAGEAAPAPSEPAAQPTKPQSGNTPEPKATPTAPPRKDR